jgi:hypothetical protein
VEYIDLSAPTKDDGREVRTYNLADLELWTPERLEDRLTMIAEALWIISENQLVQPKRRIAVRPDPEMPMF